MSFVILETVEIRLNYNFKIESALMRIRHNLRDKGKPEQKFPNPELSHPSIHEHDIFTGVSI